MRAGEFVTEYKKYPTTEYGGVTFTMVEKDGQLIVKALNDFGIAMGHVIFNMDGRELDPKDLEVEEKYQGQGIASTMYDYIKSRGFTINRSFDQTDAGRGFWDKHRGEDSYVWESQLDEANRLTLRDFVVTISPHALDQCYGRGVNAHSVDDILKNMSKVKSSILGMEPGSAFILHNGLGTGLGIRKGAGNNLTLATVYKTGKDFVKGKHPTFKVDTYPDVK